MIENLSFFEFLLARLAAFSGLAWFGLLMLLVSLMFVIKAVLATARLPPKPAPETKDSDQARTAAVDNLVTCWSLAFMASAFAYFPGDLLYGDYWDRTTPADLDAVASLGAMLAHAERGPVLRDEIARMSIQSPEDLSLWGVRDLRMRVRERADAIQAIKDFNVLAQQLGWDEKPLPLMERPGAVSASFERALEVMVSQLSDELS